ncbi:MetQ/NlpA family ABC transporter substrate-binding protein [Chlorogloeopsis sp. ULAP01]|uniref:MetQ/NlpA family ABC transporter substrate-binding protein n=1 Tax=Chlorogloeopsis sp. ULAP01 TaxID=3056483 RepID=UPI0025AA991A|nr:MetQ/NlpA family ABC transporter substrate-binding protein [Chlorogloeopsis sp. ULAP01]MDM9384066.1 MetQ/NlpA family ABC transporter substrate-binding protein [Chlorogloeopsis sp. ULAP01]
MKRRFLLIAVSSFTASIVFSGCNNNQNQTSGNSTTNITASPVQNNQQKEVIKVGVWAVISEDILRYVKDNLAANEGLDIQIVKFNDWIQPNTALRDGEIDANYFQHSPFMKNASKQLNLNLVMLNPGFLTPLGIYSKRFKSLSEVPQKATIAIYQDRSNGDRSLRLLADQGLIKLKDNVGELATVQDVAANPKNLQFRELDGPAIVRSLDDVDLAVFSAGLRLQAGLQLQPLVQETLAQKHYAVGLVTLQAKENDPKIQKLNRLLVDSRVKDFINQKYQGAVLAVF